MNKPKTFEGWEAVYSSGTDYEADLVRDRLDDSGIPAVVLTQRDHAFNLTHGELSNVHVMVPKTELEAARHILNSEPLTDDELAEVALKANPENPPGAPAGNQADSGAEHINLGPPDEA